jgi:hypothetical protein
MKIVGLGYKKGVGKSTLAKFITTYVRCTRPDINIKELSFAAKLKDICYQIYRWTGLRHGQHYENHRDEKEIVLPAIGLSPRDIWIQVGNKFREVYGTTWIDFALKGVNADILIITDVRFRNEAEAIRKKDGMLIEITRPNILQGTDPAEVDLDTWTDWDCTIANNYDLASLNIWAEALAKELIY